MRRIGRKLAGVPETILVTGAAGGRSSLSERLAQKSIVEHGRARIVGAGVRDPSTTERKETRCERSRDLTAATPAPGLRPARSSTRCSRTERTCGT